MNSNRVRWVDVCKGLAILAIFVGHIAPVDIVTTFVIRYHLPLFFFSSGFFYFKRRTLHIRTYLLKCINGTLVPYICFCALNIVFSIIVDGSPIGLSKSYLKQAFFGIRNHTGFAIQLWFFTCLFSIQILYYLLNKIVKSGKIRVLITLLSTLFSAIFLKMPNVPNMFFNIDSALYFSFYYCLGDIVYSHLQNFSFSKINVKSKIIISTISVFVLSLTFYIYCKHTDVDLIINKLSNISSNDLVKLLIFQIIILLIAILLIVANIILSFMLSNSSYLANIGKNTIILCGCENIGMVIILYVFMFFGITLKTDNILFKVIVIFLKVAIIQKIFFPLFNNSLYWMIGQSKNKKDIL